MPGDLELAEPKVSQEIRNASLTLRKAILHLSSTSVICLKDAKASTIRAKLCNELSKRQELKGKIALCIDKVSSIAAVKV